jgi:hypothetical protein
MVPASASAQSVRGIIVDNTTSAPVPSVNIRVVNHLNETVYSAVSDADGNFQITAPAIALIRLRIERIGYSAVTSKTFALEHGQTFDVEVHLSPSAVSLEPLKVVAAAEVDPRLAEFYDRAAINKKLRVGRIWTRGDLERHPPVMLSHLVRTLPNRMEASCSGRQIYVDGLPTTLPTASNFDSPPNAGADLDALDWLVDPADVEGVEVYHNAEIPFRYDQSLCQVVFVWRKPYGEGGTPLTWRRALAAFGIISAISVGSWMFWKL